MSTLMAEMSSFITKLSQLNSCGLNACLNLSTCGGRVYASLHADLGDLVTEEYLQPRKRPKPSRLRRRLRRRNEFRNSSQERTAASENRCSTELDDLPNVCETTFAKEADYVADCSTTEDVTENNLLIDFNQEVSSQPYSFTFDDLTPKLSLPEAAMSPQKAQPSLPSPSQQYVPSQIETQMYSMLKHLTSRM